ncbi:hypothetical protein [Streptomyces sp. NPDC059708]|uniref:hypothetical protein n=1 Tax=Streptomyces sp. NPDC059708 TaxID=3346916 RepID=UPI003679EF29
MAYDKGKPSLESIIQDLDRRVKTLEFAPPPEPIFDSIKVGNILPLDGSRRVRLHEVVIANPGSGFKLLTGDGRGYYMETLGSEQGPGDGNKLYFNSAAFYSEEVDNAEG